MSSGIVCSNYSQSYRLSVILSSGDITADKACVISDFKPGTGLPHSMYKREWLLCCVSIIDDTSNDQLADGIMQWYRLKKDFKRDLGGKIVIYIMSQIPNNVLKINK